MLWVMEGRSSDKIQVEVELPENDIGYVYLTVYDVGELPGTTLSVEADISSVEKIDQLILHLQEAKKALIEHRESVSNGLRW